MKHTRRVLAVLATVLMMSVAAPAQEQVPSQQPPAPQQPAPTPDRQQPPGPSQQEPAPAETPAVQTVQGELSSVDADSKTLEIKTADGSMMKFGYSDDTEVTGAKEEGVAGLATSSGSRVTVDFTEDGESKTATKIAVEAKS